ncbi:MAG TPA: hypothetical protein VME23_07170 [Terracidiphilus sp.]|jgi:hypothetical protein|nr:hypothetical protein [Terracidiphilus sp.]
MKSMLKKMVLGAAMVAGTLGLGATQAQAARIGIVVGAPVAYVPPCPGAGYAWVAGYYNGGVWVPGFWRAPRVGVYVGPGFYHGRYFYRGGYYHPGPHFRR